MGLDDIEEAHLKLTVAQMVSAGLRLESPAQSGTCPCCGENSESIANRRRNTAYHEDDLNYLTSCAECYEDDLAHYRELWAEYYAGCM